VLLVEGTFPGATEGAAAETSGDAGDLDAGELLAVAEPAPVAGLVRMSIFGPFSSRTTSAVTLTFASTSASVVTFSPSTSSRAVSSMVEPALAA